ncbi:MAG: hypothetical protein GF320_20180, partial [Armatimonadia bacterium]|nr:hypothetical protein [Armatimonadia bacterium]
MGQWRVRFGAVLAPLVVGAALVFTFGLDAARGRAPLVVWSCGGNYEVLCDYIEDFEDRTGTEVTYSAGPVQYLLEAAIAGPERPDVIVGRAGPGWIALDREGLLDGQVQFFAIDPLVIAVSPGTEQSIQTLADLGRPGVRVAASPGAMRPKGKVIGLFMASVDRSDYPGLVERWENNIAAPAKCGRFMLDPLVQGTTDAAVAPRSITTHERFRDHVRVVPIPPRHMVALKKGRASLPQCAGVLSTAADLPAARNFVQGLASADNRETLQRHGYVALGTPEAEPFEPLLSVSVPKDMAGLQVKLAQLLAEHDVDSQAVRRYWTAMCFFGPSAHDGRALCEVADLLEDRGNTEGARTALRWAVEHLPRPQPNEFTGEATSVSGDIPGVEKMPDSHWREVAEERLADLGGGQGAPPSWTELVESDPPKNGKRAFAIAERLEATVGQGAGFKDYLKVCTLNYPSRYMERAEAALASMPAQPLPELPAGIAMPEWEPAYDTHWQRGMTFGMRLYETGYPRHALKEMMKLCAGVYGSDGDAGEARYRGGVAAMACARPQAAARQWAMCHRLHPGSPWAPRAQSAMEMLDLTEPEGLPDEDGPKKGSPNVRMAIAEDLFQSGFHADDENIL